VSPEAAETFVTVERRDDGVALIRLDRPKMNALSGQLLNQLEVVAQDLTKNPPGAVVLWGGPKIFAAGADISELGATDAPTSVGSNFGGALDTLAAIPRATIAAVNGYALGGGLELALSCDMRVCGDDAKLGVPEVLLGVIPGGGGTQRLPRLIGPSRAKELIFTGRQVRADEALAMGLCNQVVPAADALGAALELAARLAKGAVLAQAVAKDAVDRGLETTLDEGMRIERQAFIAACATEDAALGIASFREHGPGKATFVGR
jgi:enoyl-CoA hydratase